MPNARTVLEQWLSKGDLQRVIDGYAALARHHAEPERMATATFQSGRYHHLLDQQRNGIISQEDYRLERARINRSMLDVVQALPPEWSAEPLAGVLPAKTAFRREPAASRSFLEKWGLIIGLVASIMAITGVTIKEFFQPAKDPAPAIVAPPSVDTQKAPAEPVRPRTVQPSAATSKAGGQRPANQPAVQQQSPSPVKQPAGTAATQLDKVFGVAEGMERGKYQGKLAFRNVANGHILCCYQDAEDFTGGRAYVGQNGRHFYIDRTGRCVEDCQ